MNQKIEGKRYFPKMIWAHLFMIVTGAYLMWVGFVQEGQKAFPYVILGFTAVYLFLGFWEVRSSNRVDKRGAKIKVYFTVLASILWFIFVYQWGIQKLGFCKFSFLQSFHWIFIILGSLFDIAETIVSIDTLIEVIRRDFSGGLVVGDGE